ncbi:YlmH family RNA-binding protein [Limosilactobacillus fastidiosus]|uniref:RNA-binding protein n=1 Tax=Limosilactobacillus fastidiosus TaxID=2759855 RepID=A0A7W3TY95_9LACO|nr:RNA-binding protein [Limosilactobacillus fastidiosus]MBB1062354.1 RNA-binding protein [Limosilactobacillus fastidiosus]MBB1085265.1 RNA-binding protein [Limosilactobacillus fastidiosus]MCD7083429.1 RNA-binding protein [Limosilactobacillus fastidiosus]MCD7085249.1 RNA-binding protein [Limosilactobacillus fastidiosus]MCD7115192.1 RNA-binding protein [Limosilactobacillus fastidiosus]
MDELNIKQHFRTDEGPIIDQINDWLVQAGDQYRPVLTPFLNPRQRYIAQTLVNGNEDVKMTSVGGWQNAEMKRVLFFPPYYEPKAEDFEITCLEVIYPQKFAELHHRQIMGTLLGEGLERATFGDIVTDGSQWQVVVTNQMARFVRERIDHVGKIKVKWNLISFAQLIEPEDDWEQLTTTVSSLRIDSIIAAGFNYSRNRAKQLLEHGFVQINWEMMQKPDYLVGEHDMLSVRHAGRLRIDQIGNVTRKNKHRITLSIIHA